MPTNIFFENLNKEEIIQILRMLEAREEKLQHQIEKLKKKIHAKKETDLAPQEKEQLMKFLQLVPLMDPQELKKESNLIYEFANKKGIKDKLTSELLNDIFKDENSLKNEVISLIKSN